MNLQVSEFSFGPFSPVPFRSSSDRDPSSCKRNFYGSTLEDKVGTYLGSTEVSSVFKNPLSDQSLEPRFLVEQWSQPKTPTVEVGLVWFSPSRSRGSLPDNSSVFVCLFLVFCFGLQMTFVKVII